MQVTQNIKPLSKHYGFTLVELLVGVTVGILVLGTVSALFVPSLETYRNTQSLSAVQENERFIFNTVGRSINQAGFFGCDSSEPQNIVNATIAGGAAWVTQLAAPVQILSAPLDASPYIGGGSGVDASGNNRLEDSGQFIGDVITTIFTTGTSSLLIGHNSTAETVTFEGNLEGILDEKLISLNDCNNSALFQLGEGTYEETSETTVFSYAEEDTDLNCDATSVTPNRVLLGGDTSANCASTAGTDAYSNYTFAPGTRASQIGSTSFYIAESEVTTGGSLFSISTSADAFSEAQELIAGIDNMRARYVVLGSAGKLVYQKAGDFDGFNGQNIDGDPTNETYRDVVAIELSLMLSFTFGKTGAGNQ